jgi:hypothetical protein
MKLFIFKTMLLNYDYLYGRKLVVFKALSTIIGTFQQKKQNLEVVFAY